jgi:hypothetical protein
MLVRIRIAKNIQHLFDLGQHGRLPRIIPIPIPISTPRPVPARTRRMLRGGQGPDGEEPARNRRGDEREHGPRAAVADGQLLGRRRDGPRRGEGVGRKDGGAQGPQEGGQARGGEDVGREEVGEEPGGGRVSGRLGGEAEKGKKRGRPQPYGATVATPRRSRSVCPGCRACRTAGCSQLALGRGPSRWRRAEAVPVGLRKARFVEPPVAVSRAAQRVGGTRSPPSASDPLALLFAEMHGRTNGRAGRASVAASRSGAGFAMPWAGGPGCEGGRGRTTASNFAHGAPVAPRKWQRAGVRARWGRMSMQLARPDMRPRRRTGRATVVWWAAEGLAREEGGRVGGGGGKGG